MTYLSQPFLSLAELADLNLPGLPKSERSLQRLAKDAGWNANPALCRRRPGRAGQFEYSTKLLPDAARVALAVHKCANSSGKTSDKAASVDAETLWMRFEALPDCDKEKARARLQALDLIEHFTGSGMSATAAMTKAAADSGVSVATLSNWKQLCRGVDRTDRLAALAPVFKREGEYAECHPDAWDFLVSLWLLPSRKAFSACFRSMSREAKKRGWSPIPSERALRRRIEQEVPVEVRILGREGREELRKLIPAQRRSVAELHALQAVNMDGHKFDVFVKWPGHDQPIRPMMVMIQDLYSRKVVAWRLSDSENKDTVRLAIGDMVSRYGIPEKLTLDNGRAFASKWISGGSKTRYRFKVKDDDPEGLVTALGIALHWATPGRGQSKPIERAFRDLAESISKHPLCDGAYTGNRPDAKPENYATRAVDLDLFRQLIAQEIAEHNAREGRRTETAQGRSFDQVFDESYRNAVVSWPTEAQRALWLMAAEKIRAGKGNGVITFMGNRYHDPALTAVAGKYVTIRFDPENLHLPLRVYETSGAFVANAAAIDMTGFYTHESGRQSARNESSLVKVTREQKRLIAKIDAATLGRMMLDHKLDAEDTPRPRVKRVATGTRSIPVPVPEPARTHEDKVDTEALLGRALRLIQGGKDD